LYNRAIIIFQRAIILPRSLAPSIIIHSSFLLKRRASPRVISRRIEIEVTESERKEGRIREPNQQTLVCFSKKKKEKKKKPGTEITPTL